MNAQSLAQMTEADHAVRMLAYYDVREVPDTQLMQIFNCGAADLAQVRQTEQYKSMLQVEQGHVTETNAAIDDGWDDVEKRALGGQLVVYVCGGRLRAASLADRAWQVGGENFLE